MGERNLEAKCLDRFSSFFLRHRLDPAPLGVTSEIPRSSITNVGLEPLPSKTLLREAFRSPATRQQAISPALQRSTSASARHSKSTRGVKYHGEGVRLSRRHSRLPKSTISHCCSGAHPHSIPRSWDRRRSAIRFCGTPRPLHLVPGSVGFDAPLLDFSFRFLGCNLLAFPFRLKQWVRTLRLSVYHACIYGTDTSVLLPCMLPSC